MAEDKNKKTTPEGVNDETEKKAITLTIPTTKKQWAAIGSKAWGCVKKGAGFVTKLGGFVGGVLTLYGAATGIVSAINGRNDEEPAKDVIDTDGDFKEETAVGSDEDIDA